MQTATTTLIALKEIAGNPPATLNALQLFLVPYTRTIMIFWAAVWCTTFVIVLWKLSVAWRQGKHNEKF